MLEILEAKRCLNCKIPKCVEGCPINNRIPEFIEQIKRENYEEAYKIIRLVNPLGAICGRVCPHENQCQGKCIKGIKDKPVQIGALEAAVCDWARENNIKINYDIKENGIKVAIIGSGPSGIACAVDLRKHGYDVTIFEREGYLGGILMYGIPEYRLPKEIVTDVINDLLELGIKVQLNTALKSENSNDDANKNNSLENNMLRNDTLENNALKNNILENYITIEQLFKENYKAIFLGIGSELSNVLPIEGNEKIGVFGANEFLKNERDCNNKKVIVIGGGNVAMDSARVAKKEGADVTIVYRKQKENMPANIDEIEAAEKEGINFVFGTNVIKINSSNVGIECKELISNEKIEDKEYVSSVECDTGKIIETDYVIMAIGSTPNKNYLDERLELTEQDLINVNETYETSIKNVFAGGDLVQKKATVCMAIKNGKEAAIAIDNRINSFR
ncbi:MAG: FAD-dependent oxidoreductase [Clostridia bacterium]|nr:FAD-dependent oxidoreductase [Clostridia bacterium]